MLLRPRIIPCLTLDRHSLVKTQRFKSPRYLGDPINAVKIFNNKGVDELVVLDITATRDKREPNFHFLERIASEAFMPLSYGGGITSLSQVQMLYRIGFEKIIMNTLLVRDERMVKEIVSFAGSQSVVASVDIKRDVWGRMKCFIASGTINTRLDPVEFAHKMESIGIGELFINSIEHDGMMNGYDIDTIREISEQVSIPVVACGGARDIQDLKKVLTDGKAQAAAAGSMFVYYGSEKAVLITFPPEEALISCGIYG